MLLARCGKNWHLGKSILVAARSMLVDSVRSAGDVKALIHYKQPLGALKGSEPCAANRPLTLRFRCESKLILPHLLDFPPSEEVNKTSLRKAKLPSIHRDAPLTVMTSILIHYFNSIYFGQS